MPDIRTLLDDATRRTPHADPVGAVRDAVHRRWVRRRVAVAAGVVVAVAATGLVVTAVRPDPAPPARSVPEWRAYSRDDGPPETPDPVFDRAAALAHAHPDVFITFQSSKMVDFGGKWLFVLSVGVDPRDWADEMDAAVGKGTWVTEVCNHTAAQYDEAYEEMRTAPWPSGGRFHAAEFENGCGVLVLVAGNDSGIDTSYARRRWGIPIVVFMLAEP